MSPFTPAAQEEQKHLVPWMLSFVRPYRARVAWLALLLFVALVMLLIADARSPCAIQMLFDDSSPG